MTMQRTGSIEFVGNLRRALDICNRLVWNSHRIGLEKDSDWPESEFFTALITQGFRGNDRLASAAFDKLLRGSPYRIRIECARHNSQAMEPLTGADLGVVTTLSINGLQTSRRGFLVQLKRAALATTAKKSTATFPELHHMSGKAAFGRELHQAERMLLFTSAAVYWLAIPPGSDKDKDFFQRYTSATSLASQSDLRAGAIGASYNHSQGMDVNTIGPLGWLPLIDHPDFDLFLRQYSRSLGRGLPMSTGELVAQHDSQEGERLIRELRAETLAASRRLYGIRSRLPILCTTAESIFSLYQTSKARSLSQVYEQSIPLTEFLLADVVANEFGDDDPDFIEAIMNNKPNDFIRQIVSEFKPSRELSDDAPITRQTVAIDLSIDARRNADRP